MIGGFIQLEPKNKGSLTGMQWNWPVALGALGALLGLGLVLYWPTAVSMARIWWNSETFAHGMLVVPIVAYMIWVRQEEVTALSPRVQPKGLWVTGGLALVWLLGYLADIQVIQQLALVGLVPALVLTLLGRQVVWALAFPLGYLFFAVPMGEDLVPPLQDFTAWFTVRALQMTGVPVYWEGHLIQLPNGNFEVAEACSGMRYLIASLALGCLYAYLNYHTLWRRLAFIALSAVVPIIANGIRAYGIVMLAHLSDMRLAVGVDHLIYGWVFFGLVILLMFWLGSLWREPQGQEADRAGSAPAPAPGTSRQPRELLTICLTALLLLAGPLAVVALEQRGEALQWSLAPPQARAGWQGPLAAPAGLWEPTYQKADAQLHQVYLLEGRPVHLYIAYYHRQQQGAELINFGNTLYSDRRWLYFGAGHHQVDLGTRQLELDTLRLGTTGQVRLTIWNWYRVAGVETTSPLMAKLLEVWSKLTDQGSAVIAVAVPYSESWQGDPEALLERFLRDMGPEIEAMLGELG